MRRKCAVILVALIAAAPAVGDGPDHPYVVLGPSDGMALDQPRVTVEVYDPGPPVESFGPTPHNQFLLDTGASGIVAVSGFFGPGAAEELLDAGYQVEGTYMEQGVAGTEEFDVSALYSVDFTDAYDVDHTITDVRMLSSTEINFGGFDGLIGMPAMVDRIVTLDCSTFPDYWALAVSFPSSLPADEGHRYSVPLELVDFPATGAVEGSPIPTFAPIPFLQAEARHGDSGAAASFLVDTGAQMSILSETVAFAAGLDEDGSGSFNEEAIDFIMIGGVGGTVMAPVLIFDELAIPTESGVELVWTDVWAAVLDIDEAIPGVIGADLLTSGWLDSLFGGDDGFIEKIHFDFREAGDLVGAMHLDINPSLDDVHPGAGDADGDGDVDLEDLFTVRNNFSSPGGWSDGDFDGDGMVDLDDLFTVRNNFYSTGAGVPEPAALVLLSAGASLLRRRRHRR